MKFSPKIKRKLYNLLFEKCTQIQSNNKTGSNRVTVSEWTAYLTNIDCRRVATKKQIEGFVFIEDPLFYGNFVRMNRDFAEKVLVLGLP